MITKIRTKGSNCIHRSLPPKNGGVWAKAGVTNIVLRPLCRLRRAPLFACAATIRSPEIGADYNGQRPNCNAALPLESGPGAANPALEAADLAAPPGPR